MSNTHRAHVIAPPKMTVPAYAGMVCCLIAFFLSVWLLDARSLWGDEAFSVWASKQPVMALIGGLDAQPPLYHLVLALSRAFWGESVFAIRFSSVICGVLLVAVAAEIGFMLGGSHDGGSVGALTALIIAVSPILIYFEQEARMYALAALMAACSMLCAVNLLTMDERRSTIENRRQPSIVRRLLAIVGYVLFSLAALFSHFYVVGVLAVNALALLVAAVRSAVRSRQPRLLITWLISHLTIVLVFSLWFFSMQSGYIGRSAAQRGRIVPTWDDIVTNLGRGINGLIFGMQADGTLTPLALILFVLALMGLIGYWRPRACGDAGRRGYAWLILGWVIASIGIVSATAAASGIVPDFNPRYDLFALVPLALAVSGWTLWPRKAEERVSAYAGMTMDDRRRTTDDGRRTTVVRALLVLVVAAPALYGLFHLFDTSWQKSRYEALIDAIRERSRPTDGLVLVNSDQFPLMDYYGPTGLQTWIVSNSELSRDVSAVTTQFDEFTRDKPRVWLVNYGWAMALQPRSIVEQQLNAKGARTYSQGFQDASLGLYDLQARSGGEDAPVQSQNVGFGEQIRLVGVRQRAREFKPGDVITLDLFWQAQKQPNADYTVFMHLRNASDGSQIAAFDSPPVDGSAPTSGWTPGNVITDTRAIQIPNDARPGEYQLIIGWYQYPSFERLKLDGQDTTEFVVSRVNVVPDPVGDSKGNAAP